VIAHSRPLLWNGPLGIFEIGQAANGIVSLAKAISSSETISIIGGGELGKATRKNACDHPMRFLRPGRGGSLEFLEGNELPGIAALDRIEIMHTTIVIACNWKMNHGVADSVPLVDAGNSRTSKILSPSTCRSVHRFPPLMPSIKSSWVCYCDLVRKICIMSQKVRLGEMCPFRCCAIVTFRM